MVLRRASILSILLFSFFNLELSSASFCGPAAIPFSFEALPNGQPVLGCARPTCFGWTADGKPASNPATFYRVNKKPDGYFRKSAADVKPKAVDAKELDNFKPQTAQCAATFEGEQCPSEYSWVGGIAPQSNVSGSPLSIQCCKYEPLKLSTDRGVAVVNPGQIVFGGEVLSGKRQYAFDYVSDVTKHTKDDGTVSYDVSIRRLACLPYPPELSINVEEVVNEEIIRRFANKTQKGERGKAFQAPIQTVGGSIVDNNIGQQLGAAPGDRVVLQPVGETERTVIQQVGQTSERVTLQQVGERVQTIEGPFVAETDSVQVVEALEGLELPPGQVPQGLIQPAAPAQAPVGGYGPVGYGPVAGYGGSGYGGGGYGGGGGGSSFYCFTADTEVRLSNGRTKRMDELELNDWVMSANRSQMVYTIVESWIHRLPDQKAEFLRIELDDGKVLKLTDKHFIYKTQCTGNEYVLFEDVSQEPVFAEKVHVGDCLYVLDKPNRHVFVERRVKDIRMVEEYGIYAPMTSNGDIVVNDVLASCYNIVNNRIMQHSVFNNVEHWPMMRWLFGNNYEADNTMELPVGISLIVDMMEHVLPKSLYSI